MAYVTLNRSQKLVIFCPATFESWVIFLSELFWHYWINAVGLKRQVAGGILLGCCAVQMLEWTWLPDDNNRHKNLIRAPVLLVYANKLSQIRRVVGYRKPSFLIPRLLLQGHENISISLLHRQLRYASWFCFERWQRYLGACVAAEHTRCPHSGCEMCEITASNVKI